MKQSLTHIKAGVLFPFWLIVALLSGLSGYAVYQPESIRTSYPTEIVYGQRKVNSQQEIRRQKPKQLFDYQCFGNSLFDWHQTDFQVTLQQISYQYHSIKAHLTDMLIPVITRAGAETFPTSLIG